MELPFLKKKNKFNSGSASAPVERQPDESSDKALIKHITDELITAIHKKDIQTLRHALQALVSQIKANQDQ
jgi:effector-binding domain-containing protein